MQPLDPYESIYGDMPGLIGEVELADVLMKVLNHRGILQEDYDDAVAAGLGTSFEAARYVAALKVWGDAVTLT